VELKGRNERNGGWVRGGRYGGKQKKGEMKSEEKAENKKKGQKRNSLQRTSNNRYCIYCNRKETNA